MRTFFRGLLALVVVLATVNSSAAQGPNGHPRPFESGYFPGLDQPRVVSTSASLQVTTDDRSLEVAYPIDMQLVRTLMIKNITSTNVRVGFTGSIDIPNFQADLFLIHPQPSYLYLAPGESYPLRVQYDIPIDSRAPNWTLGQTVSVPITIVLTPTSTVTGQRSEPDLTIVLPHSVMVVRPRLATASDPDPAPNATLTGIVRHADTLAPYANADFTVDSAAVSQRVRTDANGRYSASVFAYNRKPLAQAWREFGLKLDNTEHLFEPQAIAVPVAGQTSTVDVLVPGSRPASNYTLTTSIDVGLNAYAWDGTADGSTMATVPFHSGLDAAYISKHAFLTAFTGAGTTLWQFALNGETPAVDVSDDGQLFVATRRPLDETGPVVEVGGEIVILNRAGVLQRVISPQAIPLGEWGPETRTSKFVEVRLSHNGQYLAAGDGEGRLFLFDRASGQELWRTFTKGQVRRIDFDATDARMFVSSGDGYLRAFNRLDGTQRWKTWVDSWLTSIDFSARYILASSKAARQGLHLLDKETGATIWSYPVETIAMQAKIAPDESYVWYGTSSGGNAWLLRNAIFSIDGRPLMQLDRADRSAADAGAISGDSQRIAYVANCGVTVADRDGRKRFQSGALINTSCAGTYSHMTWMSHDGRHVVAVISPRDGTEGNGRAYFFDQTDVLPAFTTQPSSVAVAAGQNAVFTAAATGTAAPTLQWQLSINGGTTWTDIAGQTAGTLTVSGATAAMNGYRYRVAALNGAGTVTSNSATLTVASLSVGPAALIFTAVRAAANAPLISQTGAQAVSVAFAGANAAWNATTSQPWLQITNGTGTGSGTFVVDVIDNAAIGSMGSFLATVTVNVPALNLTSTVSVALSVKPAGSTAAPFGSFDTPIDGATGLSGAIAVSGWAMDDVEVARVEIWRDRVPGETTPVHMGLGLGAGKIYVASPLFVTGARPDIETVYGALPLANRAGWGYLLLTQGLWQQGNGTFKLYAFAYDRDGWSTILGTKTITANNATATKPFGSIDVPAYGQTMTKNFYNFGWALTPNPNAVDPRSCVITNGNVFVGIDSGALVPVTYGDARSDIAVHFPGFSNTDNPSGAFLIDTAAMTNGTHQIGWYVIDSCGRTEGIGSRFFSVLNAGTSASPTTANRAVVPAAAGSPVNWEPLTVRRNGEPTVVYPNPSGDRVVTIGQSERVEVHLPATDGAGYAGYETVNGEARPLPLGSSLDAAKGIFYWEPAPGFLGAHDLEFVSATGEVLRVRAVIGTAAHVAIDSPAPGTTASPFVVAGWAIDQAAASGTGIDLVHVWAFPVEGGAPLFAGAAEYGGARRDIGALFGERFAAAGYSLHVNSLPSGSYDLVVYPRSTVTGDFRGAKVVRVVVP
jgi:WD40 repeat protein